MPRPRRWTDEQLRDAVSTSTTLAEVCRKLGVRPGKYEVYRAHIIRLALDASHIPSMSFTRTNRPRRPRSWTDEDLASAVATCNTYSDVLRLLGYEPSGGTHRFIVGHIRELGLDTSHFVGQSWAKGRRGSAGPARPLNEILVEHSTYGTSKLRERLIKAGLKERRCEGCGLCEWRGQPLPMTLDHITVTTPTTGSAIFVSFVPTAMRSQQRGAGGRTRRRSPTQRQFV
ncbi:MAG: hypothetical protein QOE63_1379 [Acidimicrobiaceae bacterium]